MKSRFINSLPALSLLSISLLTIMRPALAASYFNPAFLSDGEASVADLSRFNQGDQLQGNYHVDIYINEQYVGGKNVNFLESNKLGINSGSKSGGLSPCINLGWLSSVGVNTAALPNIDKIKTEKCLDLSKIIPSSELNYDFSNQKLSVSIPQAWMINSVRGYIPPSEWDNGINAGLLNYNFSADNGSTGKSAFLSLGSGINLGAWRLRNNSSWTYNNYSNYTSQQWSNISTYAERAIVSLKSELVVGDSNTSNDVYDSLSFRGVRIYSDDAMYPDSLQGFAPTIRGIANSRAKVVVKQNGFVIYQTYVSPGAFAFSDLNPTSSSGDLTVSVYETDGTIHSFIVPYSTVPLLQREGRVKYDIVLAKYRNGDNTHDTPFFGQGTIIAGLNGGNTIYGGTQLSSNYRAFTAGFGKNMGDWGAISIDATQANSTLVDGSNHQGQSYRFLYAKSLNDLGTTFQLLGYRYSTQGFYTLDETAYKNIDGYDYGVEDQGYGDKVYTATSYHNLNYTKKGRFQLNINQALGDYGSIYAALSEQSYWNTSESNKTYQVGYSSAWHGVNYNLNWSSTQSVGLSDKDRIISLNLSVPMSILLGSKYSNSDNPATHMFLTSNITRNSDGNNTVQSGVSGTLLRDNNLSYSLTQAKTNSNGYSGTATTQYQGRYGTVSTGYSYAKNSHDYTFQASGGVVAHANGITFSQTLGDTNILVKAPGADNVKIENQTGVATDFRGYTVIPYADIYRQNRVALDSTTMNAETDILDNVNNVVPTRGSLVRASFATHIGQRALINLTYNGQPIPFGASALESSSGSSGIVGDAGQLYLSGLPQKGKVVVQWGQGADAKCSADYQLPDFNKNQPVSTVTSLCR